MNQWKDLLSFWANKDKASVSAPYPKYKPHFSPVYDRPYKFQNTACNTRDGNAYRGHHYHGAYGNSHYKPASPGPRSSMGNVSGVYSHTRSSGDNTILKKDNPFNFNEKQTMQSLNCRLESYLENVKSLKEENVMLEKKICECYEKKECNLGPSFNQYFKIISDLQNQVRSAATQNASLAQQVEDNKIVADNFRKKYEMELTKRNSYERDMYSLQRLLEDITSDSQALVVHKQNLEEELLQIKKTSEEEIISLQSQLGTRVNVDVETSPSIDLNSVLSNIRKEYESLMERNLLDVENMFFEMSSELTCEVISGIEQMQKFSDEVTDLKLSAQTLDIELTKQENMISALKCTLSELDGHYQTQLDELQGAIDTHESQLTQIRTNLKLQNDEHKVIMDVTNRLEKEINTFRQLLEGHDTHEPVYHQTAGRHELDHKDKITKQIKNEHHPL